MDLLRIEAIVEKNKHRPGATLPILHEVREEFGYVSDEAIGVIAQGLNLSRAEIFGVVSFYADFRRSPPGRHVVQICRGEACQAMGSVPLEQHAKAQLGCDYHETTSDDAISLEPVYCLGNCACSPSVRVGDEVIGRVDCERMDQLLDELRRDRKA